MRYVIIPLAILLYVFWTRSSIKCFKSGGVNFPTAIWVVFSTVLFYMLFNIVVNFTVNNW